MMVAFYKEKLEEVEVEVSVARKEERS